MLLPDINFSGFETLRLRVQAWEPDVQRHPPPRPKDIITSGAKSEAQALTNGLLGQHVSIPNWFNFRDENSQVFVVNFRQDGSQIGLLVLAQSEDRLSKYDFHIGILISDNMRGQGLATELLSGLIAESKKHEVDRIFGSVDRTNTASARVLHKAGL